MLRKEYKAGKTQGEREQGIRKTLKKEVYEGKCPKLVITL